MTTREAWGALPYDLAAFCAYQMGNQAAATILARLKVEVK
jgi:hypothetical protein